ncbi:MAG: single-stranded DNA-binding protein [Muribaculaceae bacterium]|nr:single-stranded DNA-binding protein [Muribaculaceae bacterium]
MKRNNTIGIIGTIKSQPELIIDAADWERKVYETILMRTRPSGAKDIYILQFDGHATGSREMLDRITKGTEVLIGGEIRTENVHNPQPEENRVKVYIYAEVIAINNPPVKDQNETGICGHVCKPPHFKSTYRRAITSLMIAVNSTTGTNYIPCVCFDRQAERAKKLKVGDYVEIYGRFQSRDYKKRIEGRRLPYLSTAYEVCVVKFKIKKEKKTEPGKERGADI